MATENTLVPEQELKIKEEIVTRKDELKVTNLLPEISSKTSELAKESSMEVEATEDKSEEGGANEENKRSGVEKEKDVKDDTNVEGAKKGDGESEKAVSKKDDNTGKAEEDKKTEHVETKKIENGDKTKKVEKIIEKGDKKDVKKEEKTSKEVKKVGDKKVEEAKKAENVGKKLEDNKTAQTEDKKNNSEKSTKSEKVSPLAAFFKDWDKFTTKQKIDLELYIVDKAKQMGASTTLRPGVRTMYERDRNRIKWNAIRRRRESRRRLEPSRFEPPRSRRDRRFSSRLIGAGDSRSRPPRDERRWRRYSPPREALPWRSPWASPPVPVNSLIKQMQRFVQMVDKFPSPNNISSSSGRQVLLPTPPVGYDRASRVNGLLGARNEEESRNYSENSFSMPSQRFSVPQFSLKAEEPSRRFYGKEPSSQSLQKQRPSPYRNPPPYSSTVLRNDNWSSRERGFPQSSSAVVPYKESRFSYATTYRR